MRIEPSSEQLEILDHPMGPLRIAAGAGTGKTTTVALRLARLIGQGVPPEAALGITFTNKAAEELAHRLRSVLPQLAAEGREVQVTTYHGFAHSLLEEFGALVGVEREAQIITAGYARQLLSSALEVSPTQYLDLTSFPRRVADLARLGGGLSDRLAAPAEIAARSGDEVVNERAELAAVLLRYQEEKARLGVLDFGDLVTHAHRLVTEHPDVAARIGRRYQVVLLDEYQDTNPAQRELLRAIFGPGTAITAVGDPDQTIYEWRGASLENFSRFPENFPNADGSAAPTLPLALNRRSGSHILEAANAVLTELHGHAAQRLTAHPDRGRGIVRLGWFADAVAEAHGIAAEIRRLHDEESLSWKDIAVLFRANRLVGIVRDALDVEQVPMQVAAVGGLLGVPEVADLYSWLRILGRPEDDPAVIRLLLGSTYRLDLHDLRPLGKWMRDREGASLVDAIEALDDIEDVGAEARSRLGEFGALFQDLLQTAQATALVELCRRILDRTGAWLEAEALPDASRLTARLNLYRFLDLAERWSPLEGRPSLRAFLDYLELLSEDDHEAELDTATPTSDDAVTLITVHRAKGLEWNTVFVPGLAQNVFPVVAQKYPDPYRFADVPPEDVGLPPDDLALPLDEKERKAMLRDRHTAQELRTAYVALTRAQERLYASGAFFYSLLEPRDPSLVWKLIESVDPEEWHRESEAGEPPSRLGFDLGRQVPDPDFEEGWAALLGNADRDAGSVAERARQLGVEDAFEAELKQLILDLENLPAPGEAGTPPPPDVSASGLVSYDVCPRQFAYGHIDRLPTRPSYSRRRGSEVHRRIELHHLGRLPLLDPDPDAEPDEGGTTGAFAGFMRSPYASDKPVYVEHPFRLVVDGVTIRGRIDAVFEREGHWQIVDYKTGAPRPDGSPRIQLEAYAVAALELGLVPADAPLTVSFVHLHDGSATEVSEEVDRDWIEAARAHVTALTAGIAAEDFSATPSSECWSCDFLHVCSAGKEFTGTSG